MRICAVDEVGCAAIAGPVFVCAVVAEPGDRIDGVKDSKKLKKEKREELAPIIKARLDFALGAASHKEVEHLNIYWARFLAMRRAIYKLLDRKVKIDRIIVDGNRTIDGIPLSIPQEAHPKADDTFWEVSAASIVAKVARDDLMANLAKRNGLYHYGWDTNVGYYTQKHLYGIIRHGPTSYHRRTFNGFKYALFCHKECLGFLKKGKTIENYFSYLAEYENGHYHAWKRGDLNSWKPVIYGT